nr:hypothetical protein [Brucella anthropi]
MSNTITNIKREVINNRAAISFEMNKRSFAEYLNENDHNKISRFTEDSYLLSDPSFSEEDIDDVIDELKIWLKENPVEEVVARDVTDIKREFIDGVAALTFKVAGEANLEWLDEDDHNLLTSNGDSHLSTNGNFSDEVHKAIVEQLEEWLAVFSSRRR